MWEELDRPCVGPCLLNGDTIITQTSAYSLLTGAPQRRADPLTGEPLDWNFVRNYGCNTIIG